MPLPPGTRLGPYELTAVIGAGGMGEVYRARDTRLDRTVAIKILPSTDPDRRQRFEREARAIAALSHPHICTLHDVGREHAGEGQGEVDFLVIEYLDGETLADRLKTGPLPFDRLVDLALEIVDALDAAHQAGVVHRDLKPANIFVTGRGHAKILDFGVAKLDPHTGGDAAALPTVAADTRLTGMGTALGTVAYMSPEQARGEELDARSDLFSFGLVLYEMAAGRPAFSGPTTAVVFDQILNKLPPPLTDQNASMPRQLEGLLSKALQKDRQLRYQRAADMRADLLRLRRDLASGTVAATPAGVVAARLPGRRFWSGVTMVAALIAAGVFAAKQWTNGIPGDRPIDSVVVLPFVNATGSQDAEYLTDGIADTITNNLSRIRTIRVVPRTLAARYRNQTPDPREVGRELNVRAVVMGRVSQRGDRLTIHAELIDAATVAQLWGDQFDRPQTEVLALQSDISRAIADNLRVQLTRDDERGLSTVGTRDAEAYQLYLKGRYAWHTRTTESLREAADLFQRAIARDPSYARAHAGLADTYATQAYWRYRPAREAYPEAVEAAKKAVALDDQLADAHAVLAELSMHYEWDFAQAEREYQRALTLAPDNATVRAFYGIYFSSRGRHDEGLAEVRRAIALEPRWATHHVNLGFVLSNARRYDESIAACEHALTLDPDHLLAQLDLARSYRLGRRNDFGLAISRRLIAAGDPVGETFLAASHAVAGRKAEALAALRPQVEEARRTNSGSYRIAIVYSSLGDVEQTLTWLERALAERDPFMVWVRIDPDFDPVRSDPRFERLAARVVKSGK